MAIVQTLADEKVEGQGVVVSITNFEEKVQEIIDEGGGGGAVSSVNGQTGDVVLTAGDVDAYTKSEVDSDQGSQDLLISDNMVDIQILNAQFDDTKESNVIRYVHTFATPKTIADGGVWNLFSDIVNADLTVDSKGQLGVIDETNFTIKFPNLNYFKSYKIRVNLAGTYGGGAGSNRELQYALTYNDDTIINANTFVKLTGNDLTRREFDTLTYTVDSADRFITEGIRFQFRNTTGQTLTINEVSFLLMD